MAECSGGGGWRAGGGEMASNWSVRNTKKVKGSIMF